MAPLLGPAIRNKHLNLLDFLYLERMDWLVLWLCFMSSLVMGHRISCPWSSCLPRKLSSCLSCDSCHLFLCVDLWIYNCSTNWMAVPSPVYRSCTLKWVPDRCFLLENKTLCISSHTYLLCPRPGHRTIISKKVINKVVNDRLSMTRKRFSMTELLPCLLKHRELKSQDQFLWSR